jgi:acetate kinase
VRKQIAAMMAALGGVDLLVFTGGIGENDSKVRASICAGLSWAGVSLDATQDQAKQNPVSTSSVARVLVLPSQEDQQIARHTGIIACQGFRA